MLKRYVITDKMTYREEKVWGILKDRYGQESAITSDEIKALTGINRFHLSAIVQSLRLNYKVPVCSNKWGNNKGYFLPTKESDIHATMVELEGQASKLIDVVNMLYRSAVDLSCNITYQDNKEEGHVNA